MGEGRRSIYRSEALEYYSRGGEKDVLPRVIAPPVFLWLWLLLGLCIAGVIVLIWLPGFGMLIGE
ncbi:MAG: hypothetical protein J2P37_04755 [Ktedonobacteraceae bacterium]|nr:hypothetical protein [Ktedonobacteraceae bacterium]MBO0790487.1 hypothetical protein [Ktedonobacteraceae bacterium]